MKVKVLVEVEVCDHCEVSQEEVVKQIYEDIGSWTGYYSGEFKDHGYITFESVKVEDYDG